MSSISSTVCAGCKNTLPRKEYLTCAICKAKYDNECGNVPLRQFQQMDSQHKSNWKCPECLNKQPKMGNIHTPVRSAVVSGENKTCTDTSEVSYVTTRKKPSKSPPHITSKCKDNDFDLTESKLRDIIQQELASTIQKLVSSQLNTINNQISGFYTMLDIYYQNVRGLRTKTNDVFKNILNSDYKIIALTETWLNSTISSNEIFDSRYVVYRKDRACSENSKKDGGGVLIAVSRDISSYRMTHWESDDENIWIVVDVTGNRSIKKIGLCVVYMSPPVKIEKLVKYLETVDIVTNQVDDVVIVGDFNMSFINWNSSDSCNLQRLHSSFIDFTGKYVGASMRVGSIGGWRMEAASSYSPQ
ncbi:unnamed protein product, partial [Brenthis ino]